MSEGVTQGQFFEAMQQLHAKLEENQASARRHLEARTDAILKVFKDHEDVDRLVADRVLIMETENATRDKMATKHGAIAGSIVAGALVGMFEAFKKMLGHP